MQQAVTARAAVFDCSIDAVVHSTAHVLGTEHGYQACTCHVRQVVGGSMATRHVSESKGSLLRLSLRAV